MIDHSERRLAHLLNAVATRGVLRDAATVFHLSANERDDLTEVARTAVLPFTLLPNGVPYSALEADVASGREVLFLARMHTRKRPLVFVEAALSLREEFPDTRFTLVGPDEGEAAAVMAHIEAASAQDTITWEGPLHPTKTLSRMSRASIYVLPSLDESFGMTVLEAMSIGLPTVITYGCGLLHHLHDRTSVCVVDSSLAALVTELARLLRCFNTRLALGQQARCEVNTHLLINRTAGRATQAYANIQHLDARKR
jgi:glycosyltransferase involved in cell wall biosynthesis